jgi:putative ABC transport system permease protein
MVGLLMVNHRLERRDAFQRSEPRLEMKHLRTWIARFRELFGKQRLDRDFAAELESHLQMHVEENLRAGMTAEEARRQARVKLGGVEQTKEACREQRGARWLETLLQDVRFGFRMLRKNPGFTAVAVLTLALGIGATTAIFTVVYSTLVRSLPYPEADRIIAIHDARITGRSTGGLMSGPRFFDIQARSRSFQSMAFFYFDPSTLIAGTKLPMSVISAGANAGFWDVFGVAPMLGRAFTAAEDVPNAPETVVLSYSGWQKIFGGDLNVIGRQVKLNQRAVTVIGVMPQSFSPPGGVDLWHAAQLTSSSWGSYRGEGLRFINVVGRLRPDITLERARSDLARVDEQLRREYPASDGPWRFTIETLRENRYGSLRPALLALLIASALLLLIACINVANLLLSRATARRREVALRRALGASAGRVTAQFLTESVMLALAGGAAGIAAAFALVQVFASRLPGILGRPGTVYPDWNVTGITLFICVLVGIAFGLAPTLQSRRVPLNAALKQGEARLGGSAGSALRSVLVGAQVGLCLVLLVGASLFAESLWNLIKRPLGFEPEHLLVFSLTLPWDTKLEETRNFYNDVQQRLEALPRVLSAGQIDAPPMIDWHLRRSYDADWLPRISGQPAINAETRDIAGDFLATLGTPLMAGRAFTPEDEMMKPPPVLINRALAREFPPNGNPIGHHLLLNGEAHEIVGVIGDIRGTSGSITAEPGPEVYLPSNAGGETHRYFLVRTNASPEQLTDSIREQVYQVDPQQSIGGVETMDNLLDQAVMQPRLNMDVVAAFAVIALVLACVGIYGVVAYFAAQRTQEIGVRMALGATRGNVAWLFVRRAIVPAAIGLCGGIMLAVAATRLLRSQLYGVGMNSPMLYVACALALLFPVLLAALQPAVRAAKIDPIEALRYE